MASLAVSALACTSVLTAGAASAQPGFTFDRIAGDDRFQTSALVAEEYGAGTDAILVNGQPGSFADALTANYLSGAQDAPVLLTRQGATPESVLAQLEDRGTQNITVVGGSAVVSDAQVADLEAAGYTVNRVAGADRFETNADVIAADPTADESTAIVATGFNFADALAGGPLAYKGHPLALTSQDDIDQAVVDALKDAGVDSALILGGENAVGQEVTDELEANGIDVLDRLSGAQRQDTSVEIANYAVDNLGLTDESVNVASGAVTGGGADALAGGPLTGMQNRPLLITANADAAGATVLQYVEENNDTLQGSGDIFGGNAAVSVQVEAGLTDSAQGEEPSNQSYEVTSEGAGTVDEGSEVDYTVSGLEAGQDYQIDLATSENVDQSENDVTFESASGEATFGTVQATVTRVDGVIVSSPDSTFSGTAGPNGEVTFTVKGATAAEESVTPVVHEGDALETDGNGLPTEAFGVGPASTFATAEQLALQGDSPADADFGQAHTTTVQLQTDEDAPAAYAGEDVQFVVTEEAVDGGTPAEEPIAEGVATTDVNGVAEFSHTVQDPDVGAGNDDAVETEVVAIWDENGDGEFNEDDQGATQTVNWDEAEPAEEPEVTDVNLTGVEGDGDQVNLIGTQQTLTAEVLDQADNPMEGVEVSFDVQRGGGSAPGFPTTATTNAEGVADVTYQGPNADDTVDTVTATAGDGVSSDSYEITWSEGVATVGDNTYDSIQEAVNNADAESTVAAEGSFTEEVELNTAGLTLQGDGTDLTGGFTVASAATGATIDGFDVTVTADSPQERGVVTELPQVDGLTVSNNVFTNDGGIGGVFLNVTGGQTTIEGNTFEGFAAGVSTDTSGDVAITGNTFTDNGEAIGVGGVNVTIEGNTFETDDAANDHYVGTYVTLSTSILNDYLADNTFTPDGELGDAGTGGSQDIVPVVAP